MPLYEYQCARCGKRTEKIENVSGPHIKKCPHCGGKVERLLTAPAIQFKGSGWYITDYAGKSGAKEGSASETAAAGNSDKRDSAESKDSGAKEASSPKDNKEKKPAKKK